MAQYYFEECCNPGNIYLIDNITGSFSTGQGSFIYATGTTTPGGSPYSFSGCASATTSTSIIATLTAVTNTSAYAGCDQCQVMNAQPGCCPCLFPTTVTLTTGGNFTGALAQITFSAQTGGTSVNLGTFTLPTNVSSCEYIGTYDLYFSAFNKHCYVDITGVTNCDVLYNAGPSGTTFNVHLYNVTANTSQFLFSSVTSGSQYTDIAHTTNKFFAGPMSSSASPPGIATSIYEWNISLNPFNLSGFAPPTRIIECYTAGTCSGCFSLGAGLVAINDTYLIGEGLRATLPNCLLEICVTGLTADVRVIATLSANTAVLGDILYTTNGKIITLVKENFSADIFIVQYDYLTGNQEFNLKIGDATVPSGITAANAMFIYAGELYLVDNDDGPSLYKIQTTSPYTITQVYANTFRMGGASQLPCCSTLGFV